jgi:hypothetical protein
MGKPFVIDLYCGLGGWSEGFLAEGYECIGYDLEAHDYGTGGYPGELRLRDVRSIHGSELKDATCIVGSSPCQEFSYRAMPWSRAKALPPPYLGMELFNAQFRIQREASEAAGHHIPMVVENVRGAQKWVGKAQWHYGSFYLWGDVPALMPMTFAAQKANPDGSNHGQGSWFAVADSKERGSGRKLGPSLGKRWEDRPPCTAAHREGVKQEGSGEAWFDNGICKHSSRSNSRKAASAMIAKIPFVLAQHIARCFKPARLELVANG